MKLSRIDGVFGRISKAAALIAGLAACGLARAADTGLGAESGADGCLEHRLDRAAERESGDAGLVNTDADADAVFFDEATGKNLRNYPPDRFVDFLHMKLQMKFEKLEDCAFTATETLTFKPIAMPTTSLKLNEVGLKIKNVTSDEGKVEFSADDDSLTVRFDPPLSMDKEHSLTIDYSCDHPVDG
ncbi:MAG TPA: hypothetical protein VG711_13015, partial [Phycisphaerales bacterium]|nr:hypothetical protein [Phycisphaerales bacterium]